LHAQSAPRTVTILHFNDVYEITPVEAGKSGGLARVATLRARLKAQHPGLLTVLAGDYVSPSALGTATVSGERLAGRQMVAVLNVLGLDWATLGNHEFDISEAAFHARVAESRFHLVSSNVTDVNGVPFPGIATHAIVRVRARGGVVRLGLLGLTIDANKQPWVRYAPPVDAARAAVAALKGKCDVIVALTHLALAGDQQVAEQVPEIDAILGGHEHENWLIERGPAFTPIVKADANVRTVAIVTLQIPRKGARPVVSARLERIDGRIKEAPRTAAEVKKWVDLGFQGFRAEGFDPSQTVATTPEALDGRESAVRNRPTNLTELIAEAMRRDAATDLSLFNGGSIRIDDVLPTGQITQYDVIRVLPFGGSIVRATFTGALLARVLQIGEQNRGTGGFLQYAGITRESDGFHVGGRPIDPGARYTLAIGDFLLTGGEANLGFLTRQNPEISDIKDLRDVRMAVIDELKRRFAGK
ncbi:MAG TPA: bifunctional metallophosphatase/5'-nucleotidase, partial [Vicinamibacterales bacterium]|nr:bifunctional metallophosphatase/5'-nucleotidase [Vicinamibacterales bacterium]